MIDFYFYIVNLIQRKKERWPQQMKLLQNMNSKVKKLLIFGALLLGMLVIIFIILIAIAYQQDISKLDAPLPKPLIVYDKNNKEVSELSSSKFTSVPLAIIPKQFISAIIAVEDKRFYDHSGVDFRGILRAAWNNLRAGAVVEGGSTITQQLAKNIFLTSEQTYTRKFKEAVTAFRIERKYSKDEILELYLNQIYFGEGTWGVQDAAQVYFGKNIQDITLAEAALLAGLPKSPTHYSPFQNEEKAKARRNLILKLLYDQKMIDKNEYEKAVNEVITLRDSEQDGLRGKYPGYVDYVIEEAINKYGYRPEQILIGGLHIYTQMDPVVQSAIETAYENNELFPKSSGKELVQSASVTIDPYTGGIRGIVGYRGKHFYRGFNRATQSKRQPGSSIKPLAVYAPALEKGYKPDSILIDELTDFNGYTPTNIDDNYRGSVTLYEALIHSLNVPTVALLNEMGIEYGIDFLKKAGIPLNKNDHNLSIALGGFTEGVSPLEMAQAFSVFPNLGIMNKAHAITKITSSTGKVLFEAAKEQVEVMKPENAYTMTQMLMGVVQEGTGKNAALDRPTAGKTGTTQLPSTKEYQGVSGANDAWFIGYTPELVTAVWVGYDKLDPKNVMQSTGGNHPAKIFRAIMLSALQNIAISPFPKPENYQEEGKKEGQGKKAEKKQEKIKGKGKGKGKKN
jgi:penicillin-binding protein 2A